jgi:hypothetical protein
VTTSTLNVTDPVPVSPVTASVKTTVIVSLIYAAAVNTATVPESDVFDQTLLPESETATVVVSVLVTVNVTCSDPDCPVLESVAVPVKVWFVAEVPGT